MMSLQLLLLLMRVQAHDQNTSAGIQAPAVKDVGMSTEETQTIQSDVTLEHTEGSGSCRSSCR